MSRITAYELAHTCPLLENPVLDLRVNMRLSHYYFLVDLVELLSKYSPLILAGLRKGCEEELKISAIWKIEVRGWKCFFTKTLNNELLDAVMEDSATRVCLHHKEGVIEKAIIDDVCD